MRLFIAIDIPDDLKKTIDTLSTDIPGVRWVPPEQIHLTLAFMGNVDEAVVESLNSELARIQMPEFNLCFSGTGCFPRHHRPRVFWIGVEPEPHLNELVSRVRAAVLDCGIPQEERPFSPHVTLARLKPAPSSRFRECIDTKKIFTVKRFTVYEFILYCSTLHPHGAVHVPVRKFPLAALCVGE